MSQRMLLFITLASAAIGSPVSAAASAFPTIDLGYARHIPTFTNVSQSNISYATYRNIRFAQPPVGDLRFRRPVTPPPASDGIQDGVVPLNSTNCVQTIPAWLTNPPGLNGTTWGNEDCLFLDVIVPEGLSPAAASTGVPVLHWIYGGGFFFGAKDNGANPSSLFERMAPDDKFIVVASNYRLGPLGWLSTQTEPSMDVNAGLHDAWEAVKWTRQFISMFGGNPDKVTVMGQSAGGGIIDHLLAASVQGQDVPFSQAVLSSPGYRPHVNRSQEMTDIYNIYLEATNCTDVQCLRKLSPDALKKANAVIFLDKATGAFGGPGIGFGPVIDGNLVQDLPDRVLNSTAGLGKVKRVIAGGMKDDGIGNPANSSWADFVKIFARTPSNSTVATIEDLYKNETNLVPGNAKGLPAQTVFDKFYGDVIYECHSYFAAKHWSKSGSSGKSTTCAPGTAAESYRYDESVPPATHGDDLNYYFYDKVIAAVNPVVVEKTALQFQSYLRRFILGEDMDGWPEFSSSGLESPSWMNVTADGLKAVVGEDEAVRAKRCETVLTVFGNKADGW